jgi:integrase
MYGPYRTPLFPDMRELLERLKSVTGGKPGTLLLPSESIQTVLTAACKHLGLPHISHHDLRHLFATRCLDQGRDFQVVGEWLRHRDNGRAAQLIYGHLGKSHSAEMAKGLKLI